MCHPECHGRAREEARVLGKAGHSDEGHRITHYPDKGAVAPFNARHAFRAPCDEIALSFVLYHMTSRSFRTSVLRAGPAYLVTPTLKNGEGAVGVQKLNRVPIEVKLPPPTGGGQFFVLLSGHIELLDARCTAT